GRGQVGRVTREDEVRQDEALKGRGDLVAMTGDGVNDAPALKRADIDIAMGTTGTEVSKEAAAMILTDDDFSTIVKAVRIGRGLYDNLKKYIQFQMGVLMGFIVTFLGASIFNIAGGVPFVPLQTLWVNFTTQVFQAILGTVSLTGKEWVVCPLAAFSIVAASEIQKLIRRRSVPQVTESETGGVLALEPTA